VVHEYCETVTLWYCATMRNITVSVPDDVYRAARIRAAEEGRSVSAMVAAYLRSVSSADAEFARLEAQQHRIQVQIKRFRATDRIARDEVHDRAIR
jgi:plasmid stability protein